MTISITKEPIQFFPDGYTRPPGWYYEMSNGIFNGPFETENEAIKLRDISTKANERLESLKARIASGRLSPQVEALTLERDEARAMVMDFLEARSGESVIHVGNKAARIAATWPEHKHHFFTTHVLVDDQDAS